MVKRYEIEEFEDIEWLLDEADEQGYLTLGQIIEAFPEAEEDLSELEDLFAYLQEQDIEVVESEDEMVEVDLEEGDVGEDSQEVSLRLSLRQRKTCPS